MTERREAAVEALDVSLLVACPSHVLQQSCLGRFDQKQSPCLISAFIAYIFNLESLKVGWLAGWLRKIPTLIRCTEHTEF